MQDASNCVTCISSKLPPMRAAWRKPPSANSSPAHHATGRLPRRRQTAACVGVPLLEAPRPPHGETLTVSLLRSPRVQQDCLQRAAAGHRRNRLARPSFRLGIADRHIHRQMPVIASAVFNPTRAVLPSHYVRFLDGRGHRPPARRLAPARAHSIRARRSADSERTRRERRGSRRGAFVPRRAWAAFLQQAQQVGPQARGVSFGDLVAEPWCPSSCDRPPNQGHLGSVRGARS